MENRSPNVDDIYLAALELESAEERSAYLEEACAGYPELRRRVERLLEAQAKIGSFLEAPAPEICPTVDEPIRERPGAVIGPYKLLQQIGEGGMGTVFMAEQTHPVQRKVALKLIKSGMDNRQIVARFEAERQALALMDHPNIAKVFDAATTEDGRPYFVMELVKGVPITRYCDEHHLTPKQRLELFVPVCQAVQHAHQKGIIHRDLKPSNVMVCLYDGKPVPKVIDFGIAKAAGPRLTEKTLFTEFGQVVGTLEYMSPEQAELNQLDIDTRSDIYSLGVLLYELLTGTTPLERKRFQAVAFLEVLRLIREEESPKPSTRLSTTEGLPSIAANRGLEPKKLSGLVRGELDWIVMKTLEKDRNRRYESANGLAMDLQRYLADETVQACPPSPWYRLGKVVRRNRIALTTISLISAAIVIGSAVSVWQAVRATNALETERLTQIALDKERGEKEQQQTRVNRDLADALVEATRLQEKARAGGLAAKQTWAELREVARRAEALAASELADPALVARVQPLTAELKQGETDQRMVARLDEIRVYRGILTVWNTITISISGGARPAYEAAFRDYGLPIFDLDVEEAARRIAASPIRDELVAALDECADNNGDILQRLLPIARRVEKTAWRQRYFDARIRNDPPALMLQLAKEPEALAQPPATIYMLAIRVGLTDRPTGLELLREAQRRNPADWRINSHVAEFLENTPPVSVQDAMRAAQDAMRAAEEIVGFRRAALAAYPESSALHVSLAGALYNVRNYTEVIAVAGKAIRLQPNNKDAYLLRGCAYNGARQWDKALADFNKSLEFDSNSEFDPRCLLFRASAHYHLGEWEKYIADESKYYARFPNWQISITTWIQRINAYQKLGRWEKALAAHESSIKALADTGNPTVIAEHQLAWLLATCPDLKVRNPERAVQLATKVVKSAIGSPYWCTLGVAQYRVGDWKAAIAALNKSIMIGGWPPSDWFVLAMAHQKLGNRAEALKFYGDAIQWHKKNGAANTLYPEQAEDFFRFRREAEEVLELKKK